jgi:cyclic pyranopterin phosphate synthase
MRDSLGRRIHYLRISLTDACNLRCVYCMPETIRFRPPAELLQDDEILAIVRAAASLGIDKVRLTGGEPTVRAGVVDLVRAIAAMPGLRDLSMTTNGLLLNEVAEPLARAGLQRVNISLDTLDRQTFFCLTRRDRFDDVWAGIEAAEAAGLGPIKINVVVVRGHNEEDVADLARLTLERGWDVRFIEMMPFGGLTEFALEAVVPSEETKGRIEAAVGPLLLESGEDRQDAACYYRLPGARGRIGLISSVTAPFCERCNRLRVTADGRLRPCLLQDAEMDLLTPLRNGCSFEELQELIAEGIRNKPPGHGLAKAVRPTVRVMSQIGG